MNIHYNKAANFTQDSDLRQSEHYRRVEAVVDQMVATGVLQHASGNCIAISEMVQHLLRENSVDSRMIECKVMVTELREGYLTDFKYVGWDGGNLNRTPDAMDSHVVVVTEGNRPILIDLAIPHVLIPPRILICEPVNSLMPDCIAEYKWGQIKIRYDVKKNLRLLGLHQTTLLDRMHTERRIQNSIRWLKIILAVVTVATLFNVILNTSQVVFRSQLIETLEQIENKVQRP